MYLIKTTKKKTVFNKLLPSVIHRATRSVENHLIRTHVWFIRFVIITYS